MRKPEDTPAMYNQEYINVLKGEIEHYKKLYRDLLVSVRNCKCS